MRYYFTMRKALSILLLVLLTIPALCQQSGAELRLMRENTRLRRQVDSLTTVVRNLSEVDAIWAQLSGVEEGESEWGTGVSSLEENTLPEEERRIAGRVEKLFPEMALAYSPAVRERIVTYCKPRNAALLASALRRLRRHMPYFREVFSKYGVPEELIPLCVVESAVSVHAVSPVGAAGLWQLMPLTAEGYGLRVDSKADERFSLEKSTDVAARVLRDMKRQLGSWPLAVMAYNCGTGRVRSAVIASGTSDPWTVWKKVPKETQAYLPSLLAVEYLAEYGAECGIE